MINDAELRLMFKAECEERLQRLEQDFLQLEQQPDLKSCLEEVFREVHSLKGAARMLEVKDMEQFAHCFESFLKKFCSKRLDVNIIDKLYEGVDVLRTLSNSAISGEEHGIDLQHAMAQLSEKPSTEKTQLQQNITKPEASKTNLDVNDLSEQDNASQESKTLTENNPPSEKLFTHTSELESDILETETITLKKNPSAENDAYKIATIRVTTQKLDELLTHAGELVVNKNRIEQRLSDIDMIIFLWEQWKNQQDAQYKEKYFLELDERLQYLRNHIYEDNARFSYLSHEIESGIRSIRLLPLATVFNLFPRMVRDIARQEQKQINLIISGEDTVADKRLIEEIKDPLTHLIRNAIHHAIEPSSEREALNKSAQGTIYLRAFQSMNNIVIEVEDDGTGINCEKIKQHALKRKLYPKNELEAMTESQLQALIFEHGFSTAEYITDISGRGIGLPIVRTNLEALKGRIEIESTLYQGTLIRLCLPMTLATTRVVIVKLKQRFYALGLETVEVLRSVTKKQIFNIDGRNTILHQQQAISVTHLADLLGVENTTVSQQEWMCVIIKVEDKYLAILVDDLVNEQEIMLKPLGRLLKKTPNMTGITILGDGSVCIILNPDDLIKNACLQQSSITEQKADIEQNTTAVILYAEDSITTRTQVKRILEKEGFEVVAAVDGLDAYEKLASGQFDAIVSDVNMPNMDGLTLTEKIRSNTRYQDIPIVLVSAQDKIDDKRKGLEIGANAYISKGAFDQTALIETLKRLI